MITDKQNSTVRHPTLHLNLMSIIITTA